MSATHKMDIQTFKDAFDGGTRPNRFIVSGNIGTEGAGAGTALTKDQKFLVKAASMPAQTLGVIQVPFRGRVAKLPGDRAYPEWTFTLLDDSKTSGGLRRQFETWHEKFNMHEANITKTKDTLAGKSSLYTQWSVMQIDMMGAEVRCINLHKCWPVEVGAIDLSYDTADTLTEYSITLAYDYLSLCLTSTKADSGDDDSPPDPPGTGQVVQDPFRGVGPV